MAEIGVSDLTPRQYAVLATVSDFEGLSQTDLVGRTGIDRSTLADIVRRLMTKGLLHRRRTKEDARAYAVRLTEAGRAVLTASRPVVAKVEQRILDALPQRNQAQFMADLDTIIRAFEAAQK